nr:MAG TPA: hypothetical protein [Caudoviricetes sp.]
MKIEMSIPLFLTILLLALDLSGAIDIAWYWIIAPFWLPFIIVLPLAILLTIFYYIIPGIFQINFGEILIKELN